MPKYRKRPIEVEAVQWNGCGDHIGVIDGVNIHFMYDNHRFAKIAAPSQRDEEQIVQRTMTLFTEDGCGTAFVRNARGGSLEMLSLNGRPLASGKYGVPEKEIRAWVKKVLAFKAPAVIETLEGKMTVSPGDWIIRGVAGELYPCKPDIFAATYEPVPESPTP